MRLSAPAWWRIVGDGASSSALDRDRMLFAVFVATVVHAGLILGLGTPFPVPSEREASSIAILLAPPPSSTSSRSDAPETTSATPEAVPEPSLEPTPAVQEAPPPEPSTPAREAPDPVAEQPAESTARPIWPIPDYEETVRQVARAGEDSIPGAARIRRVTGVSPASPQLSYYFEAWRRKVERVGDLNYPNAARARSLYGSLRLLVAITPDGGLADVRLLESSGHSVLDDAAVRIVRLAAPFAPFPPEMRRNTDVLEIVRTWQFRQSRDGFRTL